jgi:hypothetical protein
VAKRALLVTAALVAAVAVFVLFSLPPTPVALETAWSDGSVPGLLHIHTNRSDGQSSPDEVAAAAAKAGLKFLVFTDHGDGSREPDPPTYRSGVLCLDGVEISTTGGHYVAIGLGKAPYPLAGEPRDVVADVRRLGGFGIAAHPDSPKAELRWADWSVPIDGLEMINPDTSWRVHMLEGGWRPRFRLLRALFTYPFRGAETIASLLTPSQELEERWTALAAERRVVGVAGVDAHAKLALLGSDPGSDRYSLPVPSYESSFRVLSVHVHPSAALTGVARADADLLVQAIRSGRLYTAVDAWAAPPVFEFTAMNRSGQARGGDILPVGGPVSLHIRSNAPAGFLATVWRGSEPLTTNKADVDFTLPVDDRQAVYRVEIRDRNRPESPAWIISNPIYVQANAGHATGTSADTSAPSGSKAQPLFDGRSTAGWTKEGDQTSVTAIDQVQMVSGSELRLRYGLSGGSSVGQFSGAAVETPDGVAAFDRVAFTIRAEHPMRLSVQVRTEEQGVPPERWQRSVYVDATDGSRTVSFDDMRPVGATRTPQAVRKNVRAIMFIVDTTNTKPGASGRVWLKDVRLEQ